MDGCPFPEDRRYDVETDVWYRPDPEDRTATLGLSSLLVSFAGRFERVTYRPVEGPQEAGRSVATVESTRFTGAVRLPVRGTVLARNPALLERPKLLNDDPYERGWVVRVAPEDPGEAARRLGTAEELRPRLAARRRELGVLCLPAAPDAALYEVGTECAAALARLDEEVGRRADGEVVLLVTDDPTSPIELVRWSDRTGHRLLFHRADAEIHRFLVRREAAPRPRRR